jgi:hypothetical protein
VVQTIQKMAHGGGDKGIAVIGGQGSHRNLVWMQVVVREGGMDGLRVMEAVVAEGDMGEVGGRQSSSHSQHTWTTSFYD